MTSGALTAPRMRLTISVISAISSRPTKAVHRSSVCEPSLTCSRPISTQPSQSRCFLQPAEGARAVGVAALADRQIGVLLAQRHLAVERGDRRHPSRWRAASATAAARSRPMRRSIWSSAAMCSASVPQQPPMMLTPSSSTKRSSHCASSCGRQRIVGVAADQLGQPGIGLHRDVARPVVAEPFDVLGHLARAGRAIEPDDRHVERVERSSPPRRCRRRPASVPVVSTVTWTRIGMSLAGRLARALGAVDRGLDLQRVLAGLDQDRVDAAGDQPGALDRQRVFERPGRRYGRATAAASPARPSRRRSACAPSWANSAIASCASSAARRLSVERLVGDAELAERDRRAAEAVGLDRVAAGGEIAAMDLAAPDRGGCRTGSRCSSRGRGNRARCRGCAPAPASPSRRRTAARGRRGNRGDGSSASN